MPFPPAITDFLAQRTLAVVGVSRDPEKFGYRVWKNLREKGYRVHAVNPKVTEIDGAPCYPSLAALPEPVGGAVLVVPPAVSEPIIREAAAAGIRRVWMQLDAESPAAIASAEKLGLSVVHDACVMLLSRPLMK